MLDLKLMGVKIASMRKKLGLSQEKLAELLSVSPQAISKWENGRSLPDTSLLPMLSQIFGCTIDEIIMPAYTLDERIELSKPDILEKQAEHIARLVITQIGDYNMKNTDTGLSDQEIIDAVKRFRPDSSNFDIIRSKPDKNRRYTLIYITVNTPQYELKLVEKIFVHDDNELRAYNLLGRRASVLPAVYLISMERRIILMEDLNAGYFKGGSVMEVITGINEDSQNGRIYACNLSPLLRTTAEFHALYWENSEIFGQIGLDWRHDSEINLLAHINAMEKDLKKYIKNEENGIVPKEWEVCGKTFANTIDSRKLGYFKDAIEIMKSDYVKTIGERFHSGRNITVIHGDLHPGNTYMSKTDDRTVKFIDLQAVRMGLCTEDLAMLLALHIDADKKTAAPLLNEYYRHLCGYVKEYPYDTFINDYKLAVLENMFYTIRLINSGITDFLMRDRAIKAYETFILKSE